MQLALHFYREYKDRMTICYVSCWKGFYKLTDIFARLVQYFNDVAKSGETQIFKNPRNLCKQTQKHRHVSQQSIVSKSVSTLKK